MVDVRLEEAGLIDPALQDPVCSRIAAKIRHDEPGLRSIAPAGGEIVGHDGLRTTTKKGQAPDVTADLFSLS